MNILFKMPEGSPKLEKLDLVGTLKGELYDLRIEAVTVEL